MRVSAAAKQPIMRISHEQMERFREAAAARHCEEVRRFLDKHYPATIAKLSRDVTLERIRWGLRRIRGVGVTDGRLAALFVVTQFVAGPNFYLHPACAALFADQRLPPDTRVDSLFHADSAIPWDEIMAERDDSAWPVGDSGGFAR